VEGFRKLGYGVVANSRTIEKAGMLHDPQSVLVEGNIADCSTADRIVASVAEQPAASLPVDLGLLTKVGLNGEKRAPAIEYASRGIRMNAISPGAIRMP
jgi:hypothetical protein